MCGKLRRRIIYWYVEYRIEYMNWMSLYRRRWSLFWRALVTYECKQNGIFGSTIRTSPSTFLDLELHKLALHRFQRDQHHWVISYSALLFKGSIKLRGLQWPLCGPWNPPFPISMFWAPLGPLLPSPLSLSLSEFKILILYIYLTYHLFLSSGFFDLISFPSMTMIKRPSTNSLKW